MLDVMKEVKQLDLRTLSEVIIGLPGDSFHTIIETLKILFAAGVDSVQMYTLMLLEGSDLNSDEQRKKWGFQTKWRILPRDFVRLKDGKKINPFSQMIIKKILLL